MAWAGPGCTLALDEGEGGTIRQFADNSTAGRLLQSALDHFFITEEELHWQLTQSRAGYLTVGGGEVYRENFITYRYPGGDGYAHRPTFLPHSRMARAGNPSREAVRSLELPVTSATISIASGGTLTLSATARSACFVSYVLARKVDLVPPETLRYRLALPTYMQPPFVPGTFVRVRATATTRAGLTMTAHTLPIMLDGTPPIHPTGGLAVCTAGGLGAVPHTTVAEASWFQPSVSALDVCWTDGFTDQESGIEALEWTIYRVVNRTCPLDTSCSAQIGFASLTRAEATPILQAGRLALESASLPIASRWTASNWYTLSARVRNRAGLWSTAAQSGVLVIDTTPPSALEATLGVCDDLAGCDDGVVAGWTTSVEGRAALHATWGGFVDDESGIARCDFTVLAQDGTTVSTTNRLCEADGHMVLPSGALTDGAEYTVRLVVYNGAGLATSAIAKTLRVDATPPDASGATVLE